MICEFEPTSVEGEWVCRICNILTPADRKYTPDPPTRPCPGIGRIMDEPVRHVPACAKRPPSLVRQAWNLTRSLADFVADGCKLVDRDEYQRRLEVCDVCEFRRGNQCLECGCRLSIKAQGRAFKCPQNKWETVK